MQRSQLDNQSWSSHISGNNGLNNLWPELCQKDPPKSYEQKEQLTIIGENDGTIILDNFEYPELDGATVIPKNKHSFTARKHYLSSPILRVSTATHGIMETKKIKTVRKFKRTGLISINIHEALQNTIPRITISIRNGTDVSKNYKISKVKRKSTRVMSLLTFADRRIQKILEKRITFERQKMDAICKDVDNINFSALKVSADSETDYVKRMGAMTLYNRDYRNSHEENMSEASVYYRPDIIGRINSLCIRGGSTLNHLSAGGRQYIFKPDTTIEDDIIEGTVSLEIKDDIEETVPFEIKDEIKQEYNSELDATNFLTHSRNFREYCTNMLTPGLNESLETFLREIVRLQKRLYEKSPQKSKYKRRYYSGLKEVRKHVELKKAKFVIIAPDLEKVELEGGLNNQVTRLFDACKRQNVVFCFGLRRRKLGYFTNGKGLVSCVGVANYSGTEELFKSVLMELVCARNAFKILSGTTDTIIDVSKSLSEDYLLSEKINSLLKILSCDDVSIERDI